MAHRAFTDTSGIQWDVWEVIPQWADRRSGTQRRQRSDDDPDVDPPVIEQRRNPDRRKGLPDRHPRIRLNGGLDGGWLAFESSSQRKRLSPIPSGWERAAEQQLEEWCRVAAASPPPRRLIE